MKPDSVEPLADLVLSTEVPHTTVHRVPAERVRISRRVVTETRTITVEVRREELHVERMSVPPTADTGLARSGKDPVLTWILHEEIPEVVNRVVAVERVRVFIDDVDGTETFSIDLRHEQVALTEDDLPFP